MTQSETGETSEKRGDTVRARRREWRRHVLPLAALSAAYFLLAAVHLNRHVDPTCMDTTAYLAVACDISENGGLPGLLWRCVTGTYLEANRHPLYMVLLSPLAERDLSFFVRAKILTVIIGWAAVLATWWTLRRAFGRNPALVATGLFAVSASFSRLSGSVACESLLTLFFILAWGQITRAGYKPKHAALGGAWSGLAYLTKTSGLFLLPACFLSLLAMRKESRRARAVHAARLLLIFVAVSSPLLIRNVRVYRNPIYNINSAAFWLDSWNDFYRPEYSRMRPSAWRYLRTHSVGTAAKRLAHGVQIEARLLCEKVLPPFGLPRATRIPAGILLLLAAAYGWWRDPSRQRQAFSAALFLPMFLAFAWYYQIAVHQHVRFMLPLTPMILGYAAYGMAPLADGMVLRLGRGRLSPAMIAAAFRHGVTILMAAVAVAAFVLIDYSRQNPLRSVRVPDEYGRLADSLKQTLRPDETYLMGPNHRFDFHWHRRIPGRRLEIPEFDDFAALQAFIRRERVSHVVLDIEVVYRRRASLGAFFALDRTRGIVMRRLPPGWRLLFADEVGRADYAVFAIAP